MFKKGQIVVPKHENVGEDLVVYGGKKTLKLTMDQKGVWIKGELIEIENVSDFFKTHYPEEVEIGNVGTYLADAFKLKEDNDGSQ